MTELLSESLSPLEAHIFYITGMTKIVSRWQKCIDCSNSYSEEIFYLKKVIAF